MHCVVSGMPPLVISVSHLGKRYGATVAVDDVSLEVFEGEIFGLIGPNGAGKTTTMECVQGHRHPDRGTISVLGLDPQARRAIWGLITNIRERGTTVFLTTHLMEEAERLCDRVAIIEHGRLIEAGTPEALVQKHCPERSVVFTSDGAGVAERLRGLPGVQTATSSGSTHTIGGEGDDFVTEIINFIAREGIRVRGFRTEMPTLEDVFLKLTGHGIRD